MSDQTPFTQEELVLLVNLLMPHLVALRKKDPYGELRETKLLAKLRRMLNLPEATSGPGGLAYPPSALKDLKLVR
jgi:hypothetical protein